MDFSLELSLHPFPATAGIVALIAAVVYLTVRFMSRD